MDNDLSIIKYLPEEAAPKRLKKNSQSDNDYQAQAPDLRGNRELDH